MLQSGRQAREWRQTQICGSLLIIESNPIAEEVFEARRKLRDAGRETAIAVLDAQEEVFDARSKLIAATYDAQVAVFKVLLAMGLLGPDNLGLL